MLWMTSAPMDLNLTRSMKSRATLKFTSASSNASRTSRKESPTLSSEILPSPRKLRKAFWSLLLNESNIRLNYGSAEGFTSDASRQEATLLNFLKNYRTDLHLQRSNSPRCCFGEQTVIARWFNRHLCPPCSLHQKNSSLLEQRRAS